MPRVEIHMKISQEMKSTQGIPIYLKNLNDYMKMEKQKGRQ
jgi:hypothetical protein